MLQNVEHVPAAWDQRLPCMKSMPRDPGCRSAPATLERCAPPYLEQFPAGLGNDVLEVVLEVVGADGVEVRSLDLDLVHKELQNVARAMDGDR